LVVFALAFDTGMTLRWSVVVRARGVCGSAGVVSPSGAPAGGGGRVRGPHTCIRDRTVHRYENPGGEGGDDVTAAGCAYPGAAWSAACERRRRAGAGAVCGGADGGPEPGHVHGRVGGRDWAAGAGGARAGRGDLPGALLRAGEGAGGRRVVVGAGGCAGAAEAGGGVRHDTVCLGGGGDVRAHP